MHNYQEGDSMYKKFFLSHNNNYCIILISANKEYYHCENEPAFVSKEGLWWFNNEMKHRLDGPAHIDLVNGKKIWYYYDTLIPVDNQQDFEKYIKMLAFA